jgi:hypothetical protein
MTEVRNSNLEFLLNRYELAVKDGIMTDIFKYGEIYFRALRSGEMSDLDREHIQNNVMLCAAERRQA